MWISVRQERTIVSTESRVEEVIGNSPRVDERNGLRSQFGKECVYSVSSEFGLFWREVTRCEEFGGFGVHSVASEEFETSCHDLVKRWLRLELFVVKDSLSKVVDEVVLGVSGTVGS